MPRGRPLLHVVAPAEAAAADAAPALLDAGVLFSRYSSYAAAIAYRLLGRDDEVDDTVQEVFLAAVRGLDSVKNPEAIKGWLAAITVRTARKRLKRRRLRAMLRIDPDPDYDTVVDASASPEQRALLARVYELLDAMPTDLRIAWVLRHVQGERLEDVAELSGCSLATAKRRIAAAQRQLEEELDV